MLVSGRRVVVLAVLLAGVSARAATGQDLLSPWRWHARLLLLFAPGQDDAALIRQQQMLATHQDEARQRDLVLLPVPGEAAPGFSSADAGRVLRRQYGVAPDRFAAVLIGKDGGEKLRSDHPISPERLFAVIDRMPMRQRETRQQAERP